MNVGYVSFPSRCTSRGAGGVGSPSIITIKDRCSSAGASTFQIIQDVVENHATV
jgi:hypothetical protein